MLVMFVAGTAVLYAAETHATPAQHAAGLRHVVDLEGKEQRFDAAGSALFVSAGIASGDGGVNSAVESFTGLGAAVAMANMMAGEVTFGGPGSGLHGMLLLVILTVFVAGLIGRANPRVRRQADPSPRGQTRDARGAVRSAARAHVCRQHVPTAALPTHQDLLRAANRHHRARARRLPGRATPAARATTRSHSRAGRRPLPIATPRQPLQCRGLQPARQAAIPEIRYPGHRPLKRRPDQAFHVQVAQQAPQRGDHTPGAFDPALRALGRQEQAHVRRGQPLKPKTVRLLPARQEQARRRLINVEYRVLAQPALTEQIATELRQQELDRIVHDDRRDRGTTPTSRKYPNGSATLRADSHDQ
jgi:hypothetical protein